MISTNVIVCLGISVAICFLLPMGSFIYFAIKNKKIPKAFIIGMIVFFISQILIRIPILTYVLPNTIWFIKLSMNPYLYGVFLGLTAGIFEEVGRFIAFKFMLKKNHEWEDGISYGFGHGGIEAILITGISLLNLLIGCIMINNGTLPQNADILYKQCLSLNGTTAILGGLERLFAMSIHIGLSMIVLYGVRNRKNMYLLVAILLHTIVNAPIVILPQVFNVGIIGVEIYIFVCALGLGGFALYSKKLYQKKSNLNF